MTTDDLLAPLNDQQRHAASTLRGPVCILAGPGSGKTTTITRRIAVQVAERACEPSQILAVTFTDKAAAELRNRLAALGVQGVRARTFHAAALAQLHHLAPEPPGALLPSKALALRQLANTLPRPYRFRPAADLANEIERAKNLRIPPERYLDELGGHTPPIPPDLMASVYRRYEAGKARRGLIDFEDVLERAIALFEDDPSALELFQARYHAFTVDEYQDVNLLQQTLLERWLGERDDLCVVGDDYQSIYGFTGASPRYLLDMPKRCARTTVVVLERNHRSTPPVVALANRLASHLRGSDKRLVAVRPDGPDVVARAFLDEAAELDALVADVRALHDQDVAYEDMAVLYRVNFRSEDYEEAFSSARIPYQVRDGAFLGRPAARRLLAQLRRAATTEVAARVRALAERDGYLEEPPEGLGDQELTRQNDLARLIRLAEAFDDGERSAADFVADLGARFGPGEGRGVNLLTYHRAKGLEFEAVFLPRLVEGELPFKRARSDELVAEERRLFYVGLTRAKTHLKLSWTSAGGAKPSRFLAEAGIAGRAPKVTPGQQQPPPAVLALKAWRRQRAAGDGVPAYVVFQDRTLEAIAERRPASLADLAAIGGVGPAKLERYGRDVLEVLARLP